MSELRYPFGEWHDNTTTTSGNTIPTPSMRWYVTTYKTNPFHGWARYVFAFDEWAHRHNLNNRGPLRWLCNAWDRHLLGDDL